MPENCLYQSQITYDLPTHREFQRTALKGNTAHLILKIALSVLLALMVVIRLFTDYRYGGLVLSIYVLLVWIISFFSIRKGKNYKRTLAANMGQPQQITYQFYDDVICECNADGAAVAKFTYDQVRRVLESKNYYILMLKHNLGIIVSKDAIPESNREQFLIFLSWHCRKLKSSRPSPATAGLVMDCLTGLLAVATFILCILNVPAIQLPTYQPGKAQGTLTNDMSYDDMAQALQTIDIHISEQAIQELEEYDADYAKEYGTDYYSGIFAGSKVYDMLYWEGCGFYEEDTWVWTPSQSGVFYIYTEVTNVDTIYTDLFTGLSNMHSDLNFTNVREDYSGADLDKGRGTVKISFDWNGNSYSMDAVYDYDWLDVNILQEVTNIIASDTNSRDLYSYYDEEGYLLYYGTAEQVAQLEILTGHHFDIALSD